MRSVLSLVLIGSLLLTGCTATGGNANQTVTEPPTFTYAPGPVAQFVSLDQVRQQWSRVEAATAPPRVKVKGIYLTAYTAGNDATLKALVDLVDRTELNAMVINVKDDWGNVTFAAALPLAQEAGAVDPEIKDIRGLTGLLRSKHIYSIARVVTFKDAYVPKHRQDLAVASAHGGIWRDYNGVPWLNPYSRGAWEYIVDIARQAALAGFDEVQFDYVRFPTDGDLKAIVYPGKDSRPKEQVIGDFLAYARKELRPYGVRVSADVFGLVTSTADDMGIGQHLEEIARGVDYVSPMVYPSHYTPGNLGVPNPNAMPYETVHRSMLDAAERLGQARLTGQVTMRPWLQDFSMGYPYGPREVRAQIQATYDAGYEEWLLWNAANVYTEEALQKQGQ